MRPKKILYDKHSLLSTDRFWQAIADAGA